MKEHNSNESAPLEKPVVKTTIVGGRPPGSGKENDSVPRGIEILVKKASVDPDFKKILLKERAAAAHRISLSLENSEVTMLNSIPQLHLEGIISATKVSPNMKQIFLGCTAAVMLAALTSTVVASDDDYKTNTATHGIRSDERVVSDDNNKTTNLKFPDGNENWKIQRTATKGMSPDIPGDEKNIDRYSMLIAGNPTYENYCARGQAYRKNGHLSEALSDFNKAISKKPEEGLTYFYRAEIYYDLGAYERAWEDVHKAESLRVMFAPDNPFIVKLKKDSGREK